MTKSTREVSTGLDTKSPETWWLCDMKYKTDHGWFQFPGVTSRELNQGVTPAFVPALSCDPSHTLCLCYVFNYPLKPDALSSFPFSLHWGFSVSATGSPKATAQLYPGLSKHKSEEIHTHGAALKPQRIDDGSELSPHPPLLHEQAPLRSPGVPRSDLLTTCP